MSTPVFMKVRDWLVAAGLADGYKIQLSQWVEQKADTGAMKYIVFQSDNGTPRYGCLGASDYVLAILVSAKNDPEPAIIRAQEILDYVTHNSNDSNLNYIANTGGLPPPIPTEEGRTVIRLRFEAIS
ncbi:phage tail termination protein [Serratia fonticola]|uniref:phage tail termination protein n=1 Tax=Serratia fonticola TaxID=47917 RepID=UPI000938F013|nr:hypothetical protein [Serratia fonticola]OKP29384.1 hypothetical protein BSQ40_09180 [Serratia fonticola]